VGTAGGYYTLQPTLAKRAVAANKQAMGPAAKNGGALVKGVSLFKSFSLTASGLL
jgi:hypothetical protein